MFHRLGQQLAAHRIPHPSAVGTLVAEAGIITSLRVPGDAPEIAAPAAEAVSAVWKLGWAARGAAIHEALGADLPFGFKTIDNFSNGLATSIKSIDLRGATYQDTQRLFGRISRHVDDLADFDGGELGDIFIESSNITARTLKLATPKVDVTLAQRVAIDAATDYAKSRGITLLLVPF